MKNNLSKSDWRPWLILSLWTIFVVLGALLIQDAPAVRMLTKVEIELPPTGTIDLGRAELGLPDWERGVDSKHLGLRRDDQGDWFIANRSRHRKMDLLFVGERAETTRFPERWNLKAGDHIRLNERELRVLEADGARGLILQSDDGERVTWRAGRLTSDRRSTWPYCRYGDDWLARVRTGLHNFSRETRWASRNLLPTTEQLLFTLGGGVQCVDRWRLAGVASGGARVSWQDGRFWMEGGEGVRMAYRRERGQTWQRPTELWWPLAERDQSLRRAILGRIWFGVETSDGNLTLTPTRNLPVDFPSEAEQADEERVPEGITRSYRRARWIGDRVIQWPDGGAWVLGGGIWMISVLFVQVVRAIRREQGRGDAAFALWLKMLPEWLVLWTALILWAVVAANLARAMEICALAWLLATIQLWSQTRIYGRAGTLWGIGLGLAGIGALVLTQLAAGAENTKWLGYASGHLRILTVIAALIALAGWLPDSAWSVLAKRSFEDRRFFRRLKWLGLVGVCVLLLSQVLVGDERGLGWVQPVEFAKFVMLFLLASTLTHLHWLRRVDSRDFRRNRRTRMLAAFSFAGAFAFGAASVMLGVHDNSPLVILAAVALPLIWTAIPDPVVPDSMRTAFWRSLFVGLPLGLAVTGGVWLWHHPPDYLSAIPQAERFRVWIDPLANRFSGEQLIQSLVRVREGGWAGVGNWFGRNGEVMDLPAVQDDFIAAFLLHRFGGLAGVLLVTLQVSWCIVLIAVGRGLMAHHGEREEDRGLYRLGSLLFGLAWIQAAHWLISWCNVTGLLPVMGQPMTWLSSGNSHMLAIGFTSLWLGMIAAWVSPGTAPKV